MLGHYRRGSDMSHLFLLQAHHFLFDKESFFPRVGIFFSQLQSVLLQPPDAVFQLLVTGL